MVSRWNPTGFWGALEREMCGHQAHCTPGQAQLSLGLLPPLLLLLTPLQHDWKGPLPLGPLVSLAEWPRCYGV